MTAKFALFTAVGGLTLFVTGIGRADIPAPPVNQSLGMPDVAFTALTEEECRVCHDEAVPDRHHGLYNSVVPSLSVVPYPEFNTPGPVPPQELYSCMSCHNDVFELERDCTVCHNTASPHHQNASANAGDCKACHGFVDNMDDGHYIPTYSPSLVTPTRSLGDGEPLNSRGNGAGACDYCHDNDGQSTPVIHNNVSLHHGTNLVNFGSRCNWCHDFGLPFDEQIRVCENCHGPDSLHAIQADSNDDGQIVVGGEDAGYGHVGRDAGPDDSDCWGCHGFELEGASLPDIGPLVPALYDADAATVTSGMEATLILTGMAFTNTTNGTSFESEVHLTGADGATVTLDPDIILDQGTLIVTIPGDTPAGNYRVRAVKDEFASNPTVISVIPQVSISRVMVNRGVTTIYGSGFGGYAEGSGTEVAGTYVIMAGRRPKTMTMKGTVISWSEGRIVVSFRRNPRTVSVQSVFGLDRFTIVPE